MYATLNVAKVLVLQQETPQVIAVFFSSLAYRKKELFAVL